MSKPRIRVVGCFLEYQWKFVILHRHPNKVDGNTRWLPAWKVDPDETDLQAIIREVQEETWHLATKDKIELLWEYNFDFSDFYLEFPTYQIKLHQELEIICNPQEHTWYQRVTADECIQIPNLIRWFATLLELTWYIKSS